jgi:hypothetical protein
MRAEARGHRGAALAAVLLAITLLLPLGALAVLQARVGLLTQQSLRGDAEALHAAEAGLACALARLDPAADFDTLLRGPDGTAGTGDDGLFPAPLDCSAPLGAPLAFDVRLGAGAAGALKLVATGRGTRGATRVIEQHVWRTAPDAIEIGGWREP